MKDNYTELKLTEKQVQIVSNILQEKAFIEESYKRVSQREAEVLVSILESHGIENVQGIKFDKQSLLIPVIEKVEEVTNKN